MSSLLRAIAPELPYSGKPPTTEIDTTRCMCVGGDGPCHPLAPRHCANCDSYWTPCVRGVYSRLASGEAIHPACAPHYAEHGQCEECGKSGNRCRCTSNPIGSYHGPRSTIGRCAPTGHSYRDPLVGLECEALYERDHTTLATAIGAACHGLGPIVWAHEKDSSLGNRGVETITTPLPVSIWREVLPALWGAIAEAGGTMDHPSCGGHIHVTRTEQTFKGASLLAASYFSAPQAVVWDAIAGRPTTAYATIAPVRASPGCLPNTRAALWSAGRATIEWRHPAGTDDPRVALGRMELIVDAMAHAAQYAESMPGAPWGWGLYVRDRRDPTPATRYAWALLRSIGL